MSIFKRKAVTERDFEEWSLTYERTKKDAQFKKRYDEREHGRIGAWVVFWFFSIGLLQMIAQMFWGRSDITDSPEFLAGICFAAVAGSLWHLSSHPNLTYRD